MAEEESSAEALVSLKGIGSQSSPFNSPAKHGAMTRAKKRRQLEDSLEDDYHEELFHDDNEKLPSHTSVTSCQEFSPLSTTRSRFERSPTQLGTNGAENKKDAKSAFSKLQNLLKLPKAAKWCYFEWFYSSIDRVLFEGDNDFCVCLRESFPNLKVKNMTRIEWREIRRLMGKPRRCSPAFFQEEIQSLQEKRRKIRLLQQKKVSELSKFKDLPEEVPLPLVIGTKVTARLRSPQDGLFTGQIDAVDTQNCSYRVTFDRPGLGTHSVPDTEVLSEEILETMPLSSFLLKERPRTAVFPPTYTPPSGLSLQGSPSMVNDPLLGASPARLKLQEALNQQGQGGTLGGFPIRFLILVTRLSKILLVKKECIEKLKEMNTQAEKMKSYQDPIDKDFQRRYACVVLELERLNKDLNYYLNDVQDYCQELAPDHGLHALDQTISVKRKCDKEAIHMVEEQNAKLGSLSVKNQSTINMATKLTSILLQIKSLAENELNTFEFKSLSDAVEEIKATIDPSNESCFQNHVEIHVAHIQSGLSQMGNLHAFSS